MRLARTVQTLAATAGLAGVVAAGYFTRDRWLTPPSPNEPAAGRDGEAPPAGEPEQVKLSPQAQANLRLDPQPLTAGTFWRTVQIPGSVVDHPGHDRNVVAPVAGVVTAVHHPPGDTVRPGDRVVTLRLVSETLQLAQTELFKNTQEARIVEDQRKRLAPLATSGAISEARVLDLDNQLRRLAVAVKASRQELQTKGFTPDQIDAAADGRFVAEVVVAAPPAAPNDPVPTFEMQELRVDLGQQVQAGQTLALLSDHDALLIEGRAFRDETGLVERAAREGWPVRVEFPEDAGEWPSLTQPFVIRHVANTVDPASRTVAFTVPLANQSRTYERDGRALRLWRFRPGQRVRLHLRVERFDDVFVLPADAVAREGAEAYVFRQNGDVFDRRPVRVVYQDREHAVVANDGSVPAGVFVARAGAAQLNRALKAGGGPPPGFHVHADGSLHKNH